MEGRLHWAIWGLEQGFLRPEDLVPPTASAPAAEGGSAHVVAALLTFMGLVAAGAGKEGDIKMGLGQVAPLTGCERQVGQLASLALAFLSKVGMCIPLGGSQGHLAWDQQPMRFA